MKRYTRRRPARYTRNARKRTRYTQRRTRYMKKRRMNIRNPPFARLNGFPERMFLKLRYCDCMNTSVTGGVFSTMPYFQSSLYQPRGSGGHQPLSYDQWCSFYQKFRVYGIGYDFQICNKATNEAVWFGVRHQTSTAQEISIQTLLERGDSKVKMLGSVNSGFATTHIRGYMDVANTLGINKQRVRDDDQFCSPSNQNPAIMAYLIPYLLSNTTSGSHTFEFTIRLTYYCEMYNQADFQAS